MSKFGYRLLIITLLCMIWVTQFVSCMCDAETMGNSTSIQQEIENIKDIVDGWEVEVRY